MPIPDNPQTRQEMYLSAIANGDSGGIPETPYTRKEMYLEAIATGDPSGIPETPYTREEMYLDEIARNGGGGGGDISVVSKSISSNGTYTAPSGKAYSPVTVSVPASAVDSGTKSITSNGNNQDVVGYAAVDVDVPNSYAAGDEGKVVSNGALVSQTAHAEVTSNGTIDTTLNNSVEVNVPNTYTAGDEGKVVSNGALVAQTSDTVTQNGTIDTTLINSLLVNVSGGGGEDIVDKSITSYSSNTLESIGEYAFYNCKSLVSVSTPNLRFSGTTNNVGNSAFQGCSRLRTFDAPYEINCGSDVFNGCSSLEGAFVFSPVGMYTKLFAGCEKLTAIDVLLRSPTDKIRNSVFSGCTLLEVLILRATTLTPLDNITAFANSPFASDNSGGTLYVPAALISSYQSASNWSTILGYANNQIKSIESTHTDPDAPIDLTLYYADGTLIPTT